MKSGLVAACAAIGLFAVAPIANAGVVRLGINGVFDSTSDMGPTNNELAGLVGQAYSMSFDIGADASRLIRTELDATQPNVKGWFFNTNSTLHGPVSGYNNASGGVVVGVTDNFIYDGANGLLDAGTYDILNITGRLFAPGAQHPLVDPAACASGGSLLGDGPDPCAITGLQVVTNLTLIGKAGFFTTLAGVPFGAMDLSQVVYGTTFLQVLRDGVMTGEVAQDPPLHYENGQLTGRNMSVTTAGVPEPSTWAMLVAGFGALGTMLRRRRQAAPATT